MTRTMQRFQLSYGDCDTVGIAYFAIYYPWMERTYSTWMYRNGIRTGELAERFGIVTVGVHSEATYHRPAHVFDELTCDMVLEDFGNSSYKLGFDFRRDDELVTHGTMTFACRTPDDAKAAVPTTIAETLRTLDRAQRHSS